MDIKQAAATAEKVVEEVAKVEGPILTGVGMFVPGAAAFTVPIAAVLPLIMPDLEKALNDIAAGNNGDLLGTLLEFANHIRKGMPNSAALAPVFNPTPISGMGAALSTLSQNASQAGSG